MLIGNWFLVDFIFWVFCPFIKQNTFYVAATERLRQREIKKPKSNVNKNMRAYLSITNNESHGLQAFEVSWKSISRK